MGVLLSSYDCLCCCLSSFDGRGVCVYVIGVVFPLGQRYKYTEGDVALNLPVCDAQCAVTYSAASLDTAEGGILMT